MFREWLLKVCLVLELIQEKGHNRRFRVKGGGSLFMYRIWPYRHSTVDRCCTFYRLLRKHLREKSKTTLLNLLYVRKKKRGLEKV